MNKYIGKNVWVKMLCMWVPHAIKSEMSLGSFTEIFKKCLRGLFPKISPIIQIMT